MDDPCAQTLEALEAFIQTQRSLLARTQSDIERLRTLKLDVIEDPQDFVDNLGDKLDSPSFRLSEQTDYGLDFPEKIQWGSFGGHDISPLQHLHHKLLTTNRLRTHPSKTQTSELSSVQRLVKEARKRIIDPVLVRFPPPSPCTSDDELEEPIDPETLKRQREHEKIRELKKMQIRSTTSGMRLPGRMPGVFIRHDVEDESMDVDISVEDAAALLHRPQQGQQQQQQQHPVPTTPSRQQGQGYRGPLKDPAGPRPTSPVVPPSDDITSGFQVDHISVPAHATQALPPPSPQTTRTRRSTRKSGANVGVVVSSSIAADGSRPMKRVKPAPAVLPPPSTSSTSASTSPSDTSAPVELPGTAAAAAASGGGGGGKGSAKEKPKPETYKQAWSVSEQHLLEQLLEEIPDGEKFR
ncbi:hypothetical protein MD484_g4215, partial [Candolleomyces efflorescens]